MPRPKGSKNKKTVQPEFSLAEIEEQIKGVEAEIEEMGAALKAKKTELKELVKSRIAAEKAAAAAKAEEDKARLLEAVEASGKSVEEIIEFLK